MSEHNPGPWEWHYYGAEDEPQFLVEDASCNSIVAEIPTNAGFQEGNARLVAAAPQLLEALELIVEQDPDGEGQGFIDARAAIKAAK